ncbi:MAG: hypothetical protein ACRDTJ_13770 [Pseudonocardiaceae bacterium]
MGKPTPHAARTEYLRPDPPGPILRLWWGASAAGPGLAHHGLPHPATVDLAAALAPLVAGWLARGEPTWLAFKIRRLRTSPGL